MNELSHGDEFLRTLLENLQEGIVACDAEGNLTFFNQASQEFHGLPQEPLPAEQWADSYDLFGPDGTTRLRREEVPLFRALRGERVEDVEMVIAAKGRPPRTLLASGQAFHDAQGRLLGAVVSMHDITQRKRAEEAIQKVREELEIRVEERTAAIVEANTALRKEMAERQRAEAAVRAQEVFSRSVIESSPDCVKVLDEAGRLVHMNANGLCLLEIDDFSTFEGRSWSDLWPPEGRQNVLDSIAAARSQGSGRFQAFCPTAKGTPKWWDVIVAPIRGSGGEIASFVSVSRDITEQRRLEQDLRALAADLSEADRRKNDFLATLAHELRNPLAPLSNALHLVRLSGTDQDAIRSASEIMERQVGQMVHLVDDLLDISRISLGKLDLRRERVDLAAVVRQAVETNRPAMEAAGHALTLTLPPQPVYLHADPMRLAQVLANLLNNACKYSQPDGRVWLTAEIREGEAVISVKDAGVGIPAEMLGRIFDMFTQIDRSLERSQGGLGIGLTLVRRLVEMHGGTVSALSEGPGRGSELIVRLPVAARETTPSPEPAAGAPALQMSRRILVVDDNRDSADSLAMLLGLQGNETRVAYDGIEAIELATEFLPDVILLDIGLPRLNGYEAARRIRQQPWGQPILLLALTGWGQDEDRKKSKEAGFNGHLVKPVDLDALGAYLRPSSASEL